MTRLANSPAKFSMVLIVMLFILSPNWGISSQVQRDDAIVLSIDWSNDGTKVAMGYIYDFCDFPEPQTIVNIFDVATGALVTSIRADFCTAQSIGFSPDDSMIVVGGAGFAAIFDVATGTELSRTLSIPVSIPVDWGPVPDRFVFGLGTAMTLGTPSGDTIAIASVRGDIIDIVWEPNGNRVATNKIGGGIWIVDVIQDSIVLDISDTSTFGRLAWRSDGTQIAGAGADTSSNRILSIWDGSTGQLQRTINLPGRTYEIAWRPDSDQVAVANEGAITIWDTVGGTVVETITFDGIPYAIAWSPDGSRLAAAGQQSNGLVSELSIVVGDPLPSPQAQSIDSFTLINANTDQVLRDLTDGSIINLHTDRDMLNIRADTNPTVVGSVLFELTGPVDLTVTENGEPYALFANNDDDYNPWTPSVGSYTLTATPYTGNGLGGTAGTPLTINFTVINDDNTLSCGDLHQEAEDGFREGGFVVQADPDARGGAYIEVPDGGAIGDDRVTYCFNVTAPGVYQLKGWGRGTGAQSDSFMVDFDSRITTPTGDKIWDVPQTNDFQADYIGIRNGDDPLQFTLDVGQYNLTLVRREEGTELDQIKLELVGNSQLVNIAGAVLYIRA